MPETWRCFCAVTAQSGTDTIGPLLHSHFARSQRRSTSIIPMISGTKPNTMICTAIANHHSTIVVLLIGDDRAASACRISICR